MTHGRAYHTRQQHARQQGAQHAKQRHLQQARDHLQREQARAQRHLQALEQTLVEVGLPETLVVEVEWRLKALGKLLGNIFGVMFPTMFGSRTAYELTRVRGWDKHLPGKILGALPKQTWVRQLPHRGQDLLPACGSMSRTRAQPAGVGGHGPGWAMTASARNMASTWAW